MTLALSGYDLISMMQCRMQSLSSSRMSQVDHLCLWAWSGIVGVVSVCMLWRNMAAVDTEPVPAFQSV